MTRLPFLDNLKAPCDPGIGFSLLATHTTISGNFLYQIPKYQAPEFPGENSPNSKLAPEETKVPEPVMDCDGYIVSAAVQKFSTKSWSREVKKMKERPFICVFLD